MKNSLGRNFCQPAEWEPHSACWLAWPSHADLWQENLKPTQDEFIALCNAIGESEALDILVPDLEQKEVATRALQPLKTKGYTLRFHLIPFGDIWLRDTAPIFVRDSEQQLNALNFQFNGWGGKYLLDHDDQVNKAISKVSAVPTQSVSWVLEGGSVDVDGEGTLLTTRQCLLNENRNPGLTQEDLEAGLFETLGAKKVIWLNDGLLNDHTDGHIDTIARFVAPGVAICMEAHASNDPNRAVLQEIKKDLESAVDAKGRKLKVVTVPSPGLIADEDGKVMAASYVNFYIANKTVVVPTYGSPYDEEAVKIIGSCFPTRKTVGLSARSILSGGGAFHCISQQVPS